MRKKGDPLHNFIIYTNLMKWVIYQNFIKLKGEREREIKKDFENLGEQIVKLVMKQIW